MFVFGTEQSVVGTGHTLSSGSASIWPSGTPYSVGLRSIRMFKYLHMPQHSLRAEQGSCHVCKMVVSSMHGVNVRQLSCLCDEAVHTRKSERHS